MPDSILLGAITALAGVVATLWRQLLKERAQRDYEKRQEARLMFAMLGALARARGEAPPPTESTPEKPNPLEARTLAVRALNGDVLRLLDEYLSDSIPPKEKP